MTRTKAEGTDSLSNEPLKAKTKEISKELSIINFEKKNSFKVDSFDQAITFFLFDEMMCSFPSLTKYDFSGIQPFRSCFNTTITREIGNTRE